MQAEESNSVVERRSEAIELLLKNRPDSIKANVLEYLYKYKINAEDEFFIIFTALGELEFFLEKSPQEIQSLFKGFNEEISQWSTANLETLKHLSEKATITEKLAISSETLGRSLKEFLKVCDSLIEQLQNSNTLQTSSLSQLQTSEIELQTSLSKLEKKILQMSRNMSELNLSMEDWTDPLNELKQSINQIEKTNSQLNKGLTQINETVVTPQITWTWKWTTGDKIFVSLLAIILLVFGFSSYKQQTSLSDTNEKIQWLLEKANRQECLSGIKNPDSPECK